MTDYTNIKEFISTSTGTQGTLLIMRKIADTLVEESEKALIPRELAALYYGPGEIPGSSIDVNQVVENSAVVRAVAEGAEIAMDPAQYTTTNLLPIKYGTAIRVTREMLEDGKWNMLQHNISYIGKKVAENINSLIISEALDSAANTITGGGSITIANISRAIQYLEDADKEATDFLIGMEVANDLRNIDTFVEVDKSGSEDLLRRGLFGTIFGMKVWKVSTNAGMTTTSSYVIDRKWAYIVAEKRPLTVERFELPLFDMSGAAVTHRFKAAALRTNAIAKITTT